MTNEIRQRLKILRKELDLSQKALAESIQFKQSVYSKYETGELQPSLKMLTALVERWNVNANWLLTGIGTHFTRKAVSGDTLECITTWLLALTDEEQVWLKVEMEEKLPKFKKWLESYTGPWPGTTLTQDSEQAPPDSDRSR